MHKTQDYINISQIKDGIVLLQNGGAALILQTGAVNFGLLSTEEQISIIGSFGQMLNSLSFAIQIEIISNRLDISSYLVVLDNAISMQQNSSLAQMIQSYRQFIQSLIKDNEVLDKRFYLIIPLSYLEMGLGIKTSEEKLKKAKTMLLPRRDQVVRQLSRVGLNATHLDDEKLLKLFFNIYTPMENQPQVKFVQPAEPVVVKPSQSFMPPMPLKTPTPSVLVTAPPRSLRSHPFVVEELVDTI